MPIPISSTAVPVPEPEAIITWSEKPEPALKVATNIFDPTCKTDSTYIWDNTIDGQTLGAICGRCGKPFALHNADQMKCPLAIKQSST